MVVAILGLLTAITLPSFVKSMRGNKLRTGARTVVMAGRYARTMSLLKQQELALVFDMSSSTVSVHPASSVYGGRDSVDSDQSTVKLVSALTNSMPEGENSNAVPLDTSMLQGDSELTRKLEDIRIDYVEPSKGLRRTKGSCLVPFRSNGTCNPYEVKVIDDRGAYVIIKVDALGSAVTEGGQ